MTPMRVWPKAVGMLLAGLALAGCPAGSGARADDKPSLPSDLNLVPRDAAGFVTFRVADLAQSKPGKEFLGQIRKEMREVETAWEKEIGLPLADIERVTAVVVRPDSGGPVVITRTARPYDREKLVRTLMPNVQETKKGARAIYLDDKTQTGLFLADAQVFVRGPMQAVVSLAVGEGAQGPLADALTQAAQSHHVVAGFQPAALVATWFMPQRLQRAAADQPRPSASGTAPIHKELSPPANRPQAPAGGPAGRPPSPPDLPKPPPPPPPPPAPPGAGAAVDEQLLHQVPPEALPFKPLLEARLATLTVDLGDEIKIDLHLTYADAERAHEGETSLKTSLYVLRELIGIALRDLQVEPAVAAPLGRQLNQVRAALRDATVQTRGNTVEGTIHLKTDAELMATSIMLVRRSASQTQSANNLKQIALAFMNFSDTMGYMPPAAICDRRGKPLLSWRVAILPYLEQEALYREFHLDEPWDSEHNKKLLEKMPRFYAPVQGKPSVPHSTYYQVFVGPLTPFRSRPTGNPPFGAVGPRFPAEFPDGTSNTLLVVEGAEAVPWSKPEDLHFDMQPEDFGKNVKRPLPKLGGQFTEGFHAVFADGAVRFLKKSIDEETLRNLIMPADGNVIDWSKVQEVNRPGPGPGPTAGESSAVPKSVAPPFGEKSAPPPPAPPGSSIK